MVVYKTPHRNGANQFDHGSHLAQIKSSSDISSSSWCPASGAASPPCTIGWILCTIGWTKWVYKSSY